MGDGGKRDMDRVGLFSEMTYVTIGDKYKNAHAGSFNDAAGKGKQMLPGGSKERSARQEGFFSEKFTRILDGEAYTDPVKRRRQHRMAEAKKNLSKSFLPTNGNKTMNGMGTFFGTIGGNVKAFSPVGKGGGNKKEPLKNVITNPGKRGTGYGYVAVTLGKYPAGENQADPYDNDKQIFRKEVAQHKGQLKAGAFRLNMAPSEFFDGNPYKTDKSLPPLRKGNDIQGKIIGPAFRPSNPGKFPAGCHAGTFETYPVRSKDPYGVKDKRQINIVNKSGKIFMPSQGPKTTPSKSIVNQNVTRSVNITNYRSYKNPYMMTSHSA